jgi:hypothetical protein
MAGATDECTKTQTIACSSDYRLLVPLWRTDPLYHELRESHSSYEAQRDWWRDRHKVAAEDLGVRPKIRDIGWHRLVPTSLPSSTGFASATAKAGSASTGATTGDRAQVQRPRGQHQRQAGQGAGPDGNQGAYGEKAERSASASERRPRDGVAAHPPSSPTRPR